MFRFSCFQSHTTHSHKPKKTVQSSVEAMKKSLEDYSESEAMKKLTTSAGSSPVQRFVPEDSTSNGSTHIPSPSSLEHEWKSEECKRTNDAESTEEVKNSGHLKKSLSLGTGLDQKGRISGGVDLENETDEVFSSGSHDLCGSTVPIGTKDCEIGLNEKYQDAPPSESLRLGSSMVNDESIFSIGDPHQFEKEGFENIEPLESSDHTPRTLPMIKKSSSLPNIASCGEHVASLYLVPRSRSSEDMCVLDSRMNDLSVEERNDEVLVDVEKRSGDNPANDSCDALNYVGSAKDWVVPRKDELDKGKGILEDSSVCQINELPGKDFKIKRIEKWVMDLQHCDPLESTNGSSTSQALDTETASLVASRTDAKVTPGMEVAKKYISSLGVSSTTAQLANHGLVVIPFLSAFVSLKALNLSGNAIVRIAAGALPRGLHILNLSKNNISTIEGLRELTRLRVLDLSYNRILRIGHGLASCSSLKELYLAGNKISEVEGLHRLLKLNVLDLRFNKISTTKCLGQLAANYNSLQAVSLEGNPAQKNVGDEQLKKYIQGLLPHLAYYNRQPVKTSSSKDAPDRVARLGISAHQSDRGLRSELKNLRKVKANSSSHGRKSQAVVSPKTRGRHGHGHGRLPPSGVKTTQRQSFYDLGSKLLGFKSELSSIRRSRSEEILGAV